MNSLAPFTQNQADYLLRTRTAWFNVAEGGKRGGKNVLNALAFCIALEEHPDRLHLVGGVSVASAKLNIIDCDGYGITNYFAGRCREGTYKDRHCLYVRARAGERIILISGGGKNGDERFIKGNSYGTVYLTEANECAEVFVNEAFDRTLASKERKIFHDLNPKGPAHWYYRVLELHEGKQRENPGYGYNYGHFCIADNLSISDDKMAEAVASYDRKSVWFQRDILGKRHMVEGVIYDMWREDYCFGDDGAVPEGAVPYVGVDYGTSNPAVFLLAYDDGETIWIAREYYYSARDEHRQKEDTEYADDMEAFLGEITPGAVVVDPSAASFKVTLRNRGVTTREADNDVLEGLRAVSTMMYRGKLRIHRGCKHLLDEIATYIWDEKAAQRGEEKPLKENDHAVDALRYLIKTLVKRWRWAA